MIGLLGFLGLLKDLKGLFQSRFQDSHLSGFRLCKGALHTLASFFSVSLEASQSGSQPAAEVVLLMKEVGPGDTVKPVLGQLDQRFGAVGDGLFDFQAQGLQARSTLGQPGVVIAVRAAFLDEDVT